MHPPVDGQPASPSVPGHIDFAAAWQAYLHARPGLRLDAAADRAFWEGFAPHYDSRTALPGSFAQTLAVLRAAVRAEDTVLDVGAGTGRFALPLARVVRQVTALDHAPAMLAVLRQKLVTEHIRNISVVEAAWETADVAPHDVVFAAWSLYRQLDLRATLEKLVAMARRHLLIVAPDAADPPHRALVKAIWGRDGEPDVPTYLYILGILRQLGVRADLQVLQETRQLSGDSPAELARQLAPIDGADADVQRLASDLTALFRRSGDAWHYTYTFPVAVITWRRAG